MTRLWFLAPAAALPHHRFRWRLRPGRLAGRAGCRTGADVRA